MPNNFVVKGTAGANIDWGTDTVAYTGIGIIISATQKLTGKTLELADRQGNTNIVIFFDDKKEYSIDVIVDTSITPPVRGDAVTIAGRSGILVHDVEKKWENEKECMLTITGTFYAQLALA